MTILYDDPLPDHFVWSVVPSPQIVGQPFNVTNTACGVTNNQVNYMLSVDLSAWVPGTAPATNNLLGSPDAQEVDPDSGESVVGYSFTPDTNLVAAAVRSYFGDRVSLWTDNGVLLASRNVASIGGTWVETPLTNAVVLLAGVTYRVGVHITNGGTLYFKDNLQATFPDGTINDSWSVAGDSFPNGLDSGQYLVDLSYGTDVDSVAVSPVVSGNFNYGTWSGSLAVLQLAANVTLQSSIFGHSGQSLPFNVVPAAPKMTITTARGSVMISWPVAAAEFRLEQTYNLLAGSWTAVTNSPAVVGSNYILTNTPAVTTTFYRLRWP
jgi:hypothetical protein